MPLLLVLSAAAFVSAFSIRILDPLVPSIARDLGVLVGSAAMLAPAFTFPYALSQPILGGIGDQFGKERLIKICLLMLGLALAAAAIAPNYSTLFIARSLAGIAGGGIIPVAFAVIGDHVPVAMRQVALARLVMASQFAILVSAALSGLVAARFGWRTVFVLAAGIAAISFALMLRALPSRKPDTAPKPLTFTGLRNQYGVILSSPMAKFVLPAASIEGMTLFGLLPFIAHRLELRDYGGIEQAGFVLAAMSIGGIAFTVLVGRLLKLLGREWLFRTGGIVSWIAMAGIAFSRSWPMEATAFALLGFGFFMIHNSLQLLATELAPTARASSVAMFAFSFFLGQAIGPVLYQVGFDALGLQAPIMIAGTLLLALAFGMAIVIDEKAGDA
jgi:predicted MFS family arabinose efflux permease